MVEHRTENAGVPSSSLGLGTGKLILAMGFFDFTRRVLRLSSGGFDWYDVDMKTILLISRCPPYPIHLGARLILWHLARELARRDYVIDLLAMYSRADDPMFTAEYQAFFHKIELIPEVRRSGRAYLRRLLVPSARFADSPDQSFTPQLWQAVADYLRRRHYDLVHCFGGVSVYEFHPCFADKPTVITPYESYALFLQRAAQQGHLNARLSLPLARRFESWMFTPYDRTVVIAEPDKEMLLSLQPKLKVDVIPNGIDLERFQLQGAERAPHTLLFVGNYDYLPNQDAVRVLVQRVLPAVRQQIPQARLQLVGSSPPDWIRALANDAIEVSGHVADVQPYLAQGTVFVCPLRIGAGLKNKVLEALAMGIPVAATPLSFDGIHVRHGESAWIAAVDKIAAGVIRLLGDKGLRRRLSMNGRALIEAEYSWAQTASRYEQLYDEVAS